MATGEHPNDNYFKPRFSYSDRGCRWDFRVCPRPDSSVRAGKGNMGVRVCFAAFDFSQIDATGLRKPRYYASSQKLKSSFNDLAE
jgi:hypothetical protein